MRTLMILSGVLLWFNAFAYRQELWDAYGAACEHFDYAMRSGNNATLLQGVVAGIFILVSASPTWKLFAGGLFLKLSFDTDAEKSPVPSGKSA